MRLKTFNTDIIPWDVSIVYSIQGFDLWAKHPRAIIRFKKDGTRVYIYIRTLTEYQASNR